MTRLDISLTSMSIFGTAEYLVFHKAEYAKCGDQFFTKFTRDQFSIVEIIGKLLSIVLQDLRRVLGYYNRNVTILII